MTKSEHMQSKTSHEIDDTDDLQIFEVTMRPVVHYTYNLPDTTTTADAAWGPDRVLASCTVCLCCNHPGVPARGRSQW